VAPLAELVTNAINKSPAPAAVKGIASSANRVVQSTATANDISKVANPENPGDQIEGAIGLIETGVGVAVEGTDAPIAAGTLTWQAIDAVGTALDNFLGSVSAALLTGAVDTMQNDFQ
jgi:hypothetical protein